METQMTKKEIIQIQLCYLGYFFLNKLNTDSNYSLNPRIRSYLIEVIADCEIDWLKSGPHNDIKYNLIESGCGPIKNYTDTDLLTQFLNDQLYLFGPEAVDFYEATREIFNAIGFNKESCDLNILREMENDGIITSDDALEIFGVEL